MPKKSNRSWAFVGYVAGILPAMTLLATAAMATPSSERGGPSRHDPTRWEGARQLPRNSRSVGYPFRGRLENGVRVVENEYIRYVDEYRADRRFWGTWELVQLVERAAYRVARRVPGARLSIGELSAEKGGDVPGHSSHESGRDIDIAFYMLDGAGRPYEPSAFANFNADGTARKPNEGLVFDDARNWELVAKLVADGEARVQYIFVANTIKRRLLREGERRGAPPSVLNRAAQLLVQPASGHPHRNHFHVRIYCSPGDRPRCKDRPPFHPWYPGSPN